VVTRDFSMPAERSFLGPRKPSWIDLLRLHALRDLERAVLRRISALEALPQSPQVREELERERAHLEAVHREKQELQSLLAIL